MHFFLLFVALMLYSTGAIPQNGAENSGLIPGIQTTLNTLTNPVLKSITGNPDTVPEKNILEALAKLPSTAEEEMWIAILQAIWSGVVNAATSEHADDSVYESIEKALTNSPELKAITDNPDGATRKDVLVALKKAFASIDTRTVQSIASL